MPIAFALDGFAVFGSLEPDGSLMKILDENHGHFDKDGKYHYHATIEAPYMIGKMMGKVNEDETMQIVPQAKAKPMRPAERPLRGAAITDCKLKKTGNGYILTYKLQNETYQIDYEWTENGQFSFKMIAPSGNVNNYTYQRFSDCLLPISPK